MLIVFVFWCSCCFSLKGCVSQVFSNDDILNMQEWMAVRSITIKGELGWDDMTHTTHSTTQTFSFWHENNPSLLVTHQNNYIRSLQASIYLKHHKYGKQSLAHSTSHHSPHVCHFYVLFPISPSQPTPSNTNHLNHLALSPWHHPATIHPPSSHHPPKRLVKVPSSSRCSSLRAPPAPPAALLRRQAWQPQRKFRRDKRPRRAAEGLVEWQRTVCPPGRGLPTERCRILRDLHGEWNTYCIYNIYIDINGNEGHC